MSHVAKSNSSFDRQVLCNYLLLAIKLHRRRCVQKRNTLKLHYHVFAFDKEVLDAT